MKIGRVFLQLFVAVVALSGFAVAQKKMSETKPAPGTFVCKQADGKTACTAEHVSDLASKYSGDTGPREASTGMSSGKRQHKPVTFKVVSADGTVQCTQADGKACSDEQVQAVIEYATQNVKSVRVTKIEAITVKQ